MWEQIIWRVWNIWINNNGNSHNYNNKQPVNTELTECWNSRILLHRQIAMQWLCTDWNITISHIYLCDRFLCTQHSNAFFFICSFICSVKVYAEKAQPTTYEKTSESRFYCAILLHLFKFASLYPNRMFVLMTAIGNSNCDSVGKEGFCCFSNYTDIKFFSEIVVHLVRIEMRIWVYMCVCGRVSSRLWFQK